MREARTSCSPKQNEVTHKCSRVCASCEHDTSSHTNYRCYGCVVYDGVYESHEFRCAKHYQKCDDCGEAVEPNEIHAGMCEDCIGISI